MTLPVDDKKPRPGAFSVINRPPKAESPIRSGGILDSVPGLGGGRGPSATGSPMAPAAAPSAPPVIIR